MLTKSSELDFKMIARYNLQKQWSMLKVILHDLSNRPSVACKKSYLVVVKKAV